MKSRNWTPEARGRWIAAAEACVSEWTGADPKWPAKFRTWAVECVGPEERRAWDLRAADPTAPKDAPSRATPANWRLRDLPEAAVEALAFLGGDDLADTAPDAGRFGLVRSVVAEYASGAPAAPAAPRASVAAPPAASDIEAAGRVLLDVLGMGAAIEARTSAALASLSAETRAALAAAEKRIADAVDARLRQVQVVRHEVVLGPVTWTPPNGEPMHPAVPDALRRLRAGLNVLLYGPRGSGKTYAARQIADALGVPMHLTNCSGAANESIVRGRLVPCVVDGQAAAKFEPSPFLRAFECTCGAAERRFNGDASAECVAPCGGLAVLDEADRMAEDVAVAFNGPLCPGRHGVRVLSVPARADRPIAYGSSRCYVVATANTKFRGASQGYGAAVAQDAAFPDRFRCGGVFVGFVPEFERALGPRDLVDAVHALRKKARDAQVRECVGARFITDGAALVRAGASVAEAVSAAAWDWPAEARERCGLPALREEW